MFYFIRCVAVVLCFLLSASGECAQASSEFDTPQVGQPGKDVVWIPTAQKQVELMLNMAKVTSSDYLIDLGSGDGRMVIAAAKRGATALGIEYDPELVEVSRQAAAKEGVSARATFINADLFASDFSNATVLTLYLLPELNRRLRPKILGMKPGTRVVSNSFTMGDWEPDETADIVASKNADRSFTYFWVVPARVDGTWTIDGGQISFMQTFQKVTGTLTIRGRDTKLSGRLNGTKLTFNAGGVEYAGTVTPKAISGTRADGRSWKATR